MKNVAVFLYNPHLAKNVFEMLTAKMFPFADAMSAWEIQ